MESRSNLPSTLTRFIGRQREIAAVAESLRSTRLLTLTGPGGCGKTRLALEVATALKKEYPEGLYLADLATIHQPELIPRAVARAIGVAEGPDGLMAALVEKIAHRRMLLVLDNCEHLVDGCDRFCLELLQAAPGLTFLATSREPLAVPGEMIWPVPPLSLPPAGVFGVTEILSYEAVALFQDRATTVLPGFGLTEENAQAVAELCRRLDGLPLAIELAASRIRAITPQQCLERIDARFRLLAGRSHTLPPRQQTLRGAIDWSYSLLSEQERVLWRRLSVFPGTFSLPAAEVVTAGEPLGSEEWLDLMLRLVEKSIVMTEEQGSEKRYRMLESIREYGREQMLESGEEEALRLRYQAWCLALVKAEEPALWGPNPGPSLHRLALEHANLQEALRWCVSRSDPAHGLQLATGMVRFWAMHGHLEEAATWFKQLLAQASPTDPLRPRGLLGLAFFLLRTGESEQAERLLAEAIPLLRAQDDQERLFQALNLTGTMLVERGQVDAARSAYRDSLATATRMQDKLLMATALTNLGVLANIQGEYAEAQEQYLAALHLSEEAGDRFSMALLLNNLGRNQAEMGDPIRAKGYYEQSLIWSRGLGDSQNLGRTLCNLGDIYRQAGELDQAVAMYDEAVRQFRLSGSASLLAMGLARLASVAVEVGDQERAMEHLREGLSMVRTSAPLSLARLLDSAAELAIARDLPSHAARLYGAASEISRRQGERVTSGRQTTHEESLATLRRQLGAEGLAVEWARGEQWSTEAARLFALSELSQTLAQQENRPVPAPPPSPAQSPRATPAEQPPKEELANQRGLTLREVQILRLVARGLTAAEIGRSLFLSPRTVQKYEETLRQKLHVANRTMLAAWATRHGFDEE